VPWCVDHDRFYVWCQLSLGRVAGKFKLEYDDLNPYNSPWSLLCWYYTNPPGGIIRSRPYVAHAPGSNEVLFWDGSFSGIPSFYRWRIK
jgi:hypothetical protein